jgi:hypothetical protein
MARQNASIPLKETNRFKEGRSDSGDMKKKGPATGKKLGGPIKGGGITEKTRGKY